MGLIRTMILLMTALAGCSNAPGLVDASGLGKNASSGTPSESNPPPSESAPAPVPNPDEGDQVVDIPVETGGVFLVCVPQDPQPEMMAAAKIACVLEDKDEIKVQSAMLANITSTLIVAAGTEFALTLEPLPDNAPYHWQFSDNPNLLRGAKVRLSVNSPKEIFLSNAIAIPDAPPVLPPVNLVQNGSFETPRLTPNTAAQFWTSAQATGWQIQWAAPNQCAATPVIEYQAGAAVNVPTPEGTQYAELDSTCPTGNGNVNLSQMVPTEIGKTYEVVFSMRRRGNDDPAVEGLRVLFGGVVIHERNSTSTTWTVYRYRVTPTAAQSKLEFIETGVGNTLGTFLDNVSVKIVPTP